MKARVTLEMDLVDHSAMPLNRAQVRDALDDTEHAIRHRLFGDGFLGADVVCDSYTVNTEIVD